MSVSPSEGKSFSEDATFSAFISYAEVDKKKAFKIAEHLEAFGLKCWIAPRNVRPGWQYASEIVRGITASKCFILVLSQASNTSKFVRREVEQADRRDKRVYTLRIEEVYPSDHLQLFVSETHWIDAWASDLTHVKLLAEMLRDEEGIVEPVTTEATKRTASEEQRRITRRWAIFGVGLAGLGFAIASVVTDFEWSIIHKANETYKQLLSAPKLDEASKQQLSAVVEQQQPGEKYEEPSKSTPVIPVTPATTIPIPDPENWGLESDSGYCFQQRLDAYRFFALCFSSQQACEKVRGESHGSTVTDCQLIDLRNAKWNPEKNHVGGLTDMNKNPFGPPFPQLP